MKAECGRQKGFLKSLSRSTAVSTVWEYQVASKLVTANALMQHLNTLQLLVDQLLLCLQLALLMLHCCSKVHMSAEQAGWMGSSHLVAPAPLSAPSSGMQQRLKPPLLAATISMQLMQLQKLYYLDGASDLVLNRRCEFRGNLAMWCRCNSWDGLGAGACAWQHCHGPAGTHCHHLCCLSASVWQGPPCLLA